MSNVLTERRLRKLRKGAKGLPHGSGVSEKSPQFDFETDKRFSFGDTQIYFNLRDGVIRETKVYSDCLDTELTTEIENALTGVHFRKEEIKAALSKMKDQNIAAELAEHFCSLDI